MSYVLGIDVSTTGSKALVVRDDGDVVSSAVTEHPISTPKPLWSEQNPDDWWKSTCTSIASAISKARLSAEDIKGIGLSGQMHGLVLLDESGNVLRPSILWNDQRTGTECAEITAKVGFDRLMAITGNPVLPGFTLPKVEWVRKNEPEVFAKAAHILLPKDYIRYRLSGDFAIDVADASGTSMLDVGKRNWSQEILDILGIPGEWLPRVYESAAITGTVSRTGAEMTGLTPGLPIIAGGGDQAAGAVGSGIVEPGSVLVTIGTSGVVFAQTEGLQVEEQGRLHAFCHAVPGTWHVMGVTLAAAGSFKWYADVIGRTEAASAKKAGRKVYDVLTESAARAPLGSEGLFFLPYLSGERTPHADPNARGVFLGLTVRHGREHLVRSVLEGVAFSLRDCLELMRATGLDVGTMLATGGGANSKLWMQIISDVFGEKISVLRHTEGASYGAALLAFVATGGFSSLAEASRATLQVGAEFNPDLDAMSRYDRYYSIYRDLYAAGKPAFERIAKIES